MNIIPAIARPSVAVIGAGAIGIAIASALLRTGRTCDELEK